MEQISPHRIGWGLLLLRFLVGWVFLSEGIQKFLFPAALGAGRFEKIGIPAPQFMGPFVGATEIVCVSWVYWVLLAGLGDTAHVFAQCLPNRAPRG